MSASEKFEVSSLTMLACSYKSLLSLNELATHLPAPEPERAIEARQKIVDARNGLRAAIDITSVEVLSQVEERIRKMRTASRDEWPDLPADALDVIWRLCQYEFPEVFGSAR